MGSLEVVRRAGPCFLLLTTTLAAQPSGYDVEQDAVRLVDLAIVMGAVSAAADYCPHLETRYRRRQLNRIVQAYALPDRPGVRAGFYAAREQAKRDIEADPQAVCRRIADENPDFFLLPDR